MNKEELKKELIKFADFHRDFIKTSPITETDIDAYIYLIENEVKINEIAEKNYLKVIGLIKQAKEVRKAQDEGNLYISGKSGKKYKV